MSLSVSRLGDESVNDARQLALSEERLGREGRRTAPVSQPSDVIVFAKDCLTTGKKEKGAEEEETRRMSHDAPTVLGISSATARRTKCKIVPKEPTHARRCRGRSETHPRYSYQRHQVRS